MRIRFVYAEVQFNYLTSALIAMATKCSSVEFCGKMASDKANEIAKIVNSYDCYSANDQQSLLAVMGDYFTSNEDCRFFFGKWWW